MKKLALALTLILFVFSAVAQTSNTEDTVDKLEVVTKQKIKVFPNPASNVVNVLGLSNSAKANISISDVYGNMMLQHQWAITKNSLSIPVPNLEAGIYVIRISSLEQHVQTKFYKK